MVCVAGLALWGLSAIRSGVDQEQAGADKMIIAQHAAANMGRGESGGPSQVTTACRRKAFVGFVG